MPTILVVDDDPVVREGMRALLQCAGFLVLTAVEGAAALCHLRSGAAIDAVLLDLQMPGMDGPTFLAERRREAALASVPVVVCSGQHRRPDADVFAVLGKGARPEAILATLTRAIEDAQRRSPALPAG
jgi:CheY-like chemotaxis protein